MSLNFFFKESVRLSIDPYSNFYRNYIDISRLNEFSDSQYNSIELLLHSNEVDLVNLTLKKISTDCIRGHKVDLMLCKVLKLYPHVHSYLNAIIGRNMVPNLGYTSLTKALGKLEIRNHSVCLCNSWNPSQGIPFSKFVQEPKIDGFRITLIPENGTLVPYSRNGKLLYNCDVLIDDIIHNIP